MRSILVARHFLHSWKSGRLRKNSEDLNSLVFVKKLNSTRGSRKWTFMLVYYIQYMNSYNIYERKVLNNERKRDECAGTSHKVDAIELIYIHFIKYM